MISCAELLAAVAAEQVGNKDRQQKLCSVAVHLLNGTNFSRANTRLNTKPGLAKIDAACKTAVPLQKQRLHGQ